MLSVFRRPMHACEYFARFFASDSDILEEQHNGCSAVSCQAVLPWPCATCLLHIDWPGSTVNAKPTVGVCVLLLGAEAAVGSGVLSSRRQPQAGGWRQSQWSFLHPVARLVHRSRSIRAGSRSAMGAGFGARRVCTHPSFWAAGCLSGASFKILMMGGATPTGECYNSRLTRLS